MPHTWVRDTGTDFYFEHQLPAVACPGSLFGRGGGEGVQQILLRTEDRENGYLEAVTP